MRGRRDQNSQSTMQRHREKVGLCQSQRELSPGTKSTDILTLVFLLSRAVGNKCMLLKPPGLWNFVMAALAT
jgi:hypothetical protein